VKTGSSGRSGRSGKGGATEGFRQRVRLEGAVEGAASETGVCPLTGRGGSEEPPAMNACHDPFSGSASPSGVNW
jgi:hypothetical protein